MSRGDAARECLRTWRASVSGQELSPTALVASLDLKEGTPEAFMLAKMASLFEDTQNTSKINEYIDQIVVAASEYASHE